jgi:magnesium transporter
LLYRICDEIVISYMPIVEDLDEAIDQAEDKIFGNPDPDILAQIFGLKRSTIKMRRILGPQREVFNRLARDEYVLIDRKAQIYFRDIYDQLVRMHEIVEGIRDLVGGTLDSYLSVVNNRMNEIMKTLTLITTLFMPISFLASFFGMNFFQPAVPLEIWTGMPAFIATILLILLTPIAMYFWMRRRQWM